MSGRRPTIDPLLLASIFEAAPGRVRSRFDKQPTAAESWEWKPTPTGFEVRAGEETVWLNGAPGEAGKEAEQTTRDRRTVPDCEGSSMEPASSRRERMVIRSLDQVRCSCLLSPKCFHVLACVNVLATAADEEASHASVAETEMLGPSFGARGPLPAAGRVRDAVAGMLSVGARASGALVQSALLRAGHECRAGGLPMLGNTVLRLAEEVRRVRAQSDLTDSGQLQRDLYLALHACELLANHAAPPAWAIGTSRREFQSLAVSRFSGCFAEPVLTRSGFAGVAAYLLAPDGRFFQIHQARPGDAQLVWQSYTGGVDLGPLTAKASELCRGEWAVQNATASMDGRLGKGQATRWANLGVSTWWTGAATERFERRPDEQIQAVFAAARAPRDSRPAGWDLIALRARVLGAQGSALMVVADGLSHPLAGRIANDDPALAFRENLQQQARCSGLPFFGIGRLRIESAGEIDLLAIGPLVEDDVAAPMDQPKGSSACGEDGPRLRLPDEWRGRCNLGLDRLQRHYVDGVSRWGVEVSLDERSNAAANDGLAELDRRLTAIALGGYRALPAIDSPTHRRDVAVLRRRNQPTAADLLEALAAARSVLVHRDSPIGTSRHYRAVSFDTAYLAAARHLEAARLEFHQQHWMREAAEH